jgi:hypothetical protein
LSDVSIRAVARNIFRWVKTVNRKTLSKRFGLRTVLSKNQFGAHDRRETVWRRRSGLSSIYMIRMGLRLVQMLGITRSRLTTSCNECPVPIFSSICFLRIWFRWIQMRGAPTSTDDRRKFPLLRFPNAIVFPSIYLFRIWLQIGSDARNNAKQADDVVQDLGTSRKPAAFDNADGPIWTVGEKGFLHHPKKFQEVARPTKAFFRASLT